MKSPAPTARPRPPLTPPFTAPKPDCRPRAVAYSPRFSIDGLVARSLRLFQRLPLPPSLRTALAALRASLNLPRVRASFIALMASRSSLSAVSSFLETWPTRAM